MAASAPAPPSGAMPPAAPMPGAGAPQNATAPTDSSPQLDAGSKAVILVTQALRAIANDFPTTIPEVNQMNDLLQQVQMKMMAGAKAPTEAAPPVNG